MKILITIEPHDIPVFSLKFAYLYILSLYSVYQLKLNNNRQQELCRSKQSDFFINPNKPYYITFYIGQSYQQVSISRDV